MSHRPRKTYSVTDGLIAWVPYVTVEAAIGLVELAMELIKRRANKNKRAFIEKKYGKCSAL